MLGSQQSRQGHGASYRGVEVLFDRRVASVVLAMKHPMSDLVRQNRASRRREFLEGHLVDVYRTGVGREETAGLELLKAGQRDNLEPEADLDDRRDRSRDGQLRMMLGQENLSF